MSPSDTEWTYGTTANIGSLTFDNWKTTIGGNPPSMINQDMVLHLISDDVYIDIKFTSWSAGAGAGGGFSYQRSTDQTLGIDDIAVTKNIKLFPNPANNTIKISGISSIEKYKIYNILGNKLLEGTFNQDVELNIKSLLNGMYFIRFDSGFVMRFIKN